MEFKVRTADETETYFHGDSAYTIDNGVLNVRDEDGNRTYFSPAWWQTLEVLDAKPKTSKILS